MNDQFIILCFIVIALVGTLYLYFWKAKKEIQYKKDERWQMIQNKANNSANYVNYLLVLVAAIGEAILIFRDIQASISLNRLFIYIMLFIGLRNIIEFIALKYYDNKL